MSQVCFGQVSPRAEAQQGRHWAVAMQLEELIRVDQPRKSTRNLKVR